MNKAVAFKPSPKRPIRELDVVRLLAAVSGEDGIVPAGSVGAVVYRHRGGKAFEVEFLQPVATVLTVEAGQLAIQS